ncbi:Type 1 glutamine amidotransferase-like domain-containing protein [Actinopolymorpha alba]|uniref:Type 1 glutamine amidotransferase-like domain-containing protein n=1 Tax=Actinopolymorpha alba TaxID=533267 RepID=UPI00036A596E|nr:Type 1 glutamine amidotransferase-like domain-containing protein [Actinopolymorpha alba]
MTGKVFLAGGGGAADSRPLDERFAATIGSGPLSYWPVALDPHTHDYAACLSWLRGVYRPLGVRHITMWTGNGRISPGDFRGIYIGGGNTYSLLSIVHRFGLLDALREYVAAGGAVFGGSAGAALLGADITTIAHLDRNDVGLEDTRGTDLAAGCGVFVHHRDSDLPRESVWVASQRRPVIALTERSNAIITGSAITAVGIDPVVLVNSSGHKTLAPGATSYDGLAVQ